MYYNLLEICKSNQNAQINQLCYFNKVNELFTLIILNRVTCNL